MKMGLCIEKNYGYSKFLIIIVWLNKNKNPYFPSQRTLKKLLKNENVCSNNDKHIGENTVTWVARKCSEWLWESMSMISSSPGMTPAGSRSSSKR